MRSTDCLFNFLRGAIPAPKVVVILPPTRIYRVSTTLAAISEVVFQPASSAGSESIATGPRPTQLQPDSNRSLQAGELHIWLTQLDRSVEEATSLKNLLSADECARADRFKFERDRQRYVVGRGILRQILEEYTQCPAQQLCFAYGRRGKPSLPGSAFQFNMSHSGGLAAIAITSGRAIGIDLEHARSIPDWHRVMTCCFSNREQAAILELPEEQQLAGFFTCWTRKEAYVKATGDGLSIPLERFTVAVEPNSHPCLLEVLDQPSDTTRWHFTNLPVADDYIGVVAHDGPIGSVVHQRW
ncbi:4'-phosphopantetheinyl transferase superfamily protein [soil metagenome]